MSNTTPKVLLVCAFHREAAPLIEHYGLKRDISSRGHHVFLGEFVTLILSGPGKVRSAVATTRGIVSLRQHHLICINVGCCAGLPAREVGSALLAHRIIDHATARSFHSDILVPTSLPSSSLETFDKPVANARALSPGVELADMEASGFFEAAATFLGPHAIFCIKVVSDHVGVGEASFPPHHSKEFQNRVESLIRARVSGITSAICALQNITAFQPEAVW